MRTVINWRPYPEQKPPKGGDWYLVLEGGDVFHAYYEPEQELAPWSNGDCEEMNPTHFALPSDITTEESP